MRKTVPNGEREKIELEKQLVREGKIFPRAHYAPRGRLRGIIALVLAFLFGILLALGGVIGVGAYLSTRKVKDILGQFDLEAEDYLTEEYAAKSVIQLVASLAEQKYTSFQSLANITPYARKAVEGVASQLSSLGANVDVDAFMNVEFSSLGAYLRDDVLMQIELGKALGLTSTSDKIMLALCYGKEGTDYTVNDAGEIVMNAGKTPTLLSSLVDDASGILGRMDVGTVIGASDSSSPIVQAIKDWKIEDFKDPARINRLKIKQVMTLGENPSNLLRSIADWRIGDLSDQNKINSLCLGDVIAVGETSPQILRSIKDLTLGELDTGIRTLRLGEILGEEQVASNRILKHLSNSTVDTLSDDLTALTVGEVFEEEVYSYMIVEDGKDYESYWNEYKTHHTEKDYNEASYRPTEIGVKGNETFRRYRVADGTAVEKGYYSRSGEAPYTYTKIDGAAKYDAAIARENRKEGADRNTPWYWEREVRLTPNYCYAIVDYANQGAYVRIPDAAVRTEGENVYYTDEEGEHLLEEDENCLFYRNAAGERIDIDRLVASYEGGGKTYPCDEKGVCSDGEGNAVTVKTHVGEETYAYLLERVPVYEMYEDGAGKTYAESETREKFSIVQDGEEKELDRYVTGVWHLILKSQDEAGNITYKTETPILQMDAIITSVSSAINNTYLYELWFHGLIKSNPYVDISAKIKGGLTIGGRQITNLIEVTLGETVELVKQVVEKIPSAPLP